MKLQLMVHEVLYHVKAMIYVTEMRCYVKLCLMVHIM
jgi:hypothetical protein